MMRRAGSAALLFGSAISTVAAAAPGGDVADTWVVPPVLASGARLPVPIGAKVSWQAEGARLVDGTLVNEGRDDVDVRLTGMLTTANHEVVTKRFTVRLLGGTGQRLVAYARTPTDIADANQPLIARSVHLALGADAAHAQPLNGDYGALFAIGEYSDVDRVELRGIVEPTPFHFADGSLGIIARRVLVSGAPDPAHPRASIVFRAERDAAADFTELGLIELPAGGAIATPRAIWDSAADRYIVSWSESGGGHRWTTVKDLARTEEVPTRFFPENGGRRRRIVGEGNVGEARAGTLPVVDGLAVDAKTSDALLHRFGRIVNVGSEVAPFTIARGQVAALADVRATLRYSDGSRMSRAVDWDAGEVRRLAAAKAGSHVLHGVVRQRSYPRIFAYNRADPMIFRYDAVGRVRYLFIATDDTNNDNVGSPHLPIRVADTIADLADANGGRAREVDLLNRVTRRERTAEGRMIAGCYWAPELHMIGGRLSILFAPCFNPDDPRSNARGSWQTVEAHIMQLRAGGDPANPRDWSAPAAVRKPDGSALGRPEFPRNISLDMSYVEQDGRSYYTWSQRYIPASGALGDPLTWIAQVDPAKPTRLVSEPRPIIAPNLGFEENLAEGAFALHHDGRIHLVYSASGVSPTYVVGGTWAKAGDDLTDIDNWHRWKAPLQKSQAMPRGVTDYRRYEQGPGHGAFVRDEDGAMLYVYHTWGNGVGGDGRDARVRRLHWAADGRPVLDMSEDEEVAPAYRRVTIRVTVAGR